MKKHPSNSGEQHPPNRTPVRRESVRETALDYARGAGGGLFIGLPLLMTMEMWWSGFSMPGGRMLLLFGVNFGVLLILEHYSGFREEETFLEEAEDAVVALGLGLVISALLLFLFGAVRPGMPAHEVLGKIIMESIPVSIGASVAIGQLGTESVRSEAEKERAGFWGSQAIALAGAVVFGANIAPTAEPVIVGLRMEWWHGLALLLLSLVQVHALVYAVEFRGSAQVPRGRAWWQVFLSESMVSYATALLLAAYLLWTFGRIGAGTGATATIGMTVALGFVTSLGAAAGKLIL